MPQIWFLLLVGWAVLVATAEQQQLRFNENGRFKVVQFTDLHYGNNQRENDQTYAVQDAILAAEKPDLVIITGDLISGYEWDGKEAEWFKKRWKQLVSPMIKHNIRWAIALGNHDVEGDLTGKEIVDLDKTEPLSLTQRGPSDIAGATNFYLPIYTEDNTTIGQVLWVFDSGNSGCLGVSGWGCIQYDQIEWYRNTSRSIAIQQHVPKVPALAFFHIPLYEHLDLWNVHSVYGDLAEGEGVCCSSVNTGLYSAMKQMGDIKGVYCGHDHSNDYIGDYHGISLGFGRKTGYGCYGPPFGWKHGARVIEIEQHRFGVSNTWLRLEDGSIEIQELNPVSMRKFLGCCQMAGHGRVAIGWYGILVGSLLILGLVVLIAVAVTFAIRRYRRANGKFYDSVPSSLEISEGGVTSTDSLKGYRRDSQTIPRQRRNNGTEIACLM